MCIFTLSIILQGGVVLLKPNVDTNNMFVSHRLSLREKPLVSLNYGIYILNLYFIYTPVIMFPSFPLPFIETHLSTNFMTYRSRIVPAHRKLNNLPIPTCVCLLTRSKIIYLVSCLLALFEEKNIYIV